MPHYNIIYNNFITFYHETIAHIKIKVHTNHKNEKETHFHKEISDAKSKEITFCQVISSLIKVQNLFNVTIKVNTT